MINIEYFNNSPHYIKSDNICIPFIPENFGFFVETDEKKKVVLDIEHSKSEVTVTTLSGEKAAYNSIEKPHNIKPVVTKERLEQKRLLPPYSFTILRIKGEKQ